MGIKTIIFDLGNVLVKVDPRKSILKVRELVPQKSFKDVRQLIDDSEMKRQYELGEMDDRDFFYAMKENLQIDFTFEFFQEIWKDFFTPIQPMIDLLPTLKKSHCLVMLSDTNPMHTAVCREKFDFFQWFDHFVFSCEVGYLKPDPNIYRVALEQAKSKPEEAVFIDDKLKNVKGAEDVGIRGFHFQGADHFLKTFPNILGRSFE